MEPDSVSFAGLQFTTGQDRLLGSWTAISKPMALRGTFTMCAHLCFAIGPWAWPVLVPLVIGCQTAAADEPLTREAMISQMSPYHGTARAGGRPRHVAGKSDVRIPRLVLYAGRRRRTRMVSLPLERAVRARELLH